MSNAEYLSNLRNQQMCEPKEGEKFYPSKIQEFIKNGIEVCMRGYEFDANNLSAKTEEIAKSVRESVRVGAYQLSRYKLVVQVVLGEIKNQGLKISSKCLWDVNSDNYASYTHKTETFYCTAIVFGCYNE